VTEDIEKGAFRFVINRELMRWRSLRARFAAEMGEQAAAEIDEDLQKASDPENFDDKEHGQRIAVHLHNTLNELEYRALPAAEQIKHNQAEYARRYELPDAQEAMRRIRATSADADKSSLMPATLALSEDQVAGLYEWRYHPLHTAVAGEQCLVTQVAQGSFVNEPATRIRWESPRFHGSAIWLDEGVEPVKAGELVKFACIETHGRLLRDGPEIQLLALEVVDGPLRRRDPTPEEVAASRRTRLTNQKVTVPEALPWDCTDETPEEAEARLKDIQHLAGIYDRRLDPRGPTDVAKEDEARAVEAAAEAAASHTTGSLAEVEQALQVLYKAAGLDVAGLTVTPEHVILLIRQSDGEIRRVLTALPTPLKALASPPPPG
jgi:hypothetical protein